MDYLPVYLNITDKKILVIGGGKTALQKIKSLLQFSKNITVLAKSISKEIEATEVTIIQAEYSTDILSGYDIVYACTDDRTVNQRIKNDAARLKIPVNVVDDPALCDFITPAVYAEDNFCIAVSSYGNAPGAAAKIRDLVKQKLPPEELRKIVEKGREDRRNKS